MSTKSSIHVGDRVQFRFGTRILAGTVKEDRGPIGVKGRHLYRVAFSTDDPEPLQIELPADELRPWFAVAVLNLSTSEPTFEETQNLTSMTDRGGYPGVDLTLCFDNPLQDDLYRCEVSANRDVKYRVLSKNRDSVRITIEPPLPDRVKIVCSDL